MSTVWYEIDAYLKMWIATCLYQKFKVGAGLLPWWHISLTLWSESRQIALILEDPTLGSLIHKIGIWYDFCVHINCI